jgi:hypothetical protein
MTGYITDPNSEAPKPSYMQLENREIKLAREWYDDRGQYLMTWTVCRAAAITRAREKWAELHKDLQRDRPPRSSSARSRRKARSSSRSRRRCNRSRTSQRNI